MFNEEQSAQECLATVYEMIEALKSMPLAQQAYLQGVIAGMKMTASLPGQ